MPDAWLVCQPVREGLVEVERRLRALVAEVGPVATHLIDAGGKRLRPALVLLAAQFGRPDDRTILAAAALETAHIASLYHDDVMDQARTRRGRPSVNAIWGNRVAGAAGCYLASVATRAGASLGDAVNEAVSNATQMVWRGQMLQLCEAGRLDVPEHRIFDIAERKTAALFQLAARLGVLTAGVPEADGERLTGYARLLGMAFQFADDVLDIVGEESTLGKRAGDDIRQGAYTLPVYYTIRGDCAGGADLRRLLRDRDVEGVLALLRHNGSVDRTLEVARDHSRRACERLADLRPGPSRDSLENLAEFTVSRVARLVAAGD